MHNNIRKRTLGFSMIELLVTLLILSALTMIALPAMSSFIQNDKIASNTNRLLSSLVLARSEAIDSSYPTVICPSSNQGISCTNSNWVNGWMVFQDIDGDRGFSVGDVRIKVQIDITDAITITTSSGLQNGVVFDKRGYTLNSSGDWNLCDSRGLNFGKTIRIMSSGRISKGSAGALRC